MGIPQIVGVAFVRLPDEIGPARSKLMADAPTLCVTMVYTIDVGREGSLALSHEQIYGPCAAAIVDEQMVDGTRKE